MSFNKKKHTYTFDDVSVNTLSDMKKEDLFDYIYSLHTIIKGHKEREEVIRARLRKCYDYFKKQGLNDSEIIEITKLDCEIR